MESRAGYVKVGGEEVKCGVRLLEQSENEIFSFDVGELKQLSKEKGVNSNQKVLANNILHLIHAGYNDETKFNGTSHYHSSKADGLVKYKKSSTENPPVINIIQGDIIEYARQVKEANPEKNVAVLNPANRTHVGGGAFLGANALEEIFFRCSNLVLLYAKHARDKGFHYTKYGNHARPDYNTHGGRRSLVY